MPHTIWKYTIPPDHKFILSLPWNAEVLCVQVQHDIPYIWALVNPDSPKQDRLFLSLSTGQRLSHTDPASLRYVGTFQLRGGSLVFHLFEYP